MKKEDIGRAPALLTVLAVLLIAACGHEPDPVNVGGPTPVRSLDTDGDGILDQADRCPTQPETRNRVFDADGCPDQPSDLYAAVRNDVDSFWNLYFNTRLGRPYFPANFRMFFGSVVSACGPGSGPLYCALDFTVYLDDPFLASQLARFGDFAPAMIIAHEIGHHTQNILGVFSQFSIQKELQADCLAGGWAASAGARGLLDAGDLQEAAASLFSAADMGLPWFAPGAHGSGAQRQQAFATGFSRGAFFC